MADRILSEKETAAIERWLTGEDFTEETWSYAVYCEAWRHVEALTTSHRLLAERNKELEAALVTLDRAFDTTDRTMKALESHLRPPHD